ncbi:hydantoinase/oxoprolinase family protein [Mangrovibrevibacter kandeliae]|uniref:hydantoinase/oxoprolinase family protein n=1 Tax=Mangrovibrevibacter kandeliae TaxID=2968473 RepID=UPI002118154D|nr:hydantoinase/oxoprolinase family protein [Aurantimonas sp. CSK15Z-1]MCQ8783161.1 S-layer protein [Aurantimonas sp. CSK15Z-1]
MVRSLGWDVGGAHLKAALAEDGRIVRVWQRATPIWQDLRSLEESLDEILGVADDVDRHAVTMTGELSDLFANRADGVERLTNILSARLGRRMELYAGRAGFVPASAAPHRYADIASANWHATASLAATTMDEALVMDMGSTTTDIVPVAGKATRAAGYTDAERMVAGELVYQGFTRTSLMAVAERVPFAGTLGPVMSEHFATMADVERLLDCLEEDDDQYPAADGKAKTLEASRARLARMIGRDASEASLEAWAALAQCFAEAQLRKVHDAALQVLSRGGLSDEAPVVVAGIGRPQLRRVAARLDRGVVDFADLLDCPSDLRDAVTRVAPAAALAVLAAEAD